MPIGGGILPASGSNQFTELTYVTRRAFIPKMVVQIYNFTPLMAALIANSQTASGGVSSVTVPRPRVAVRQRSVVRLFWLLCSTFSATRRL
jgi:hypothetical protein